MNPYVVSDQMIADVFETARLKGIDYWCPEVWQLSWVGFPIKLSTPTNYGRWLAQGSSFAIADDPEGEHWVSEYEWHPLNRDRLIRGIREAAETQGISPEVWHRQLSVGDADAALQIAIFGHVVYGV